MSRASDIARSLRHRHAPRAIDSVLPRGVVLGHRGASALAPENTLAAFERCAGAGLGFELDVSSTADGELVLLHDDLLDRTTSGAGPVRETPWEVVRGLSAGAWFDESYRDERVPTLDEVLGRFVGRVPIDIELKTDPDPQGLVDRFVEILRGHKAEQQVVVTSFDPFVLGALADREPACLRGQIVGRLHDSGLGRLSRLALENMWLNRVSRPDLICADEAVVDEALLQWCERRRLPVMVWTVDDPERARALRDLGAWGFIADDPEPVRDALS